MAKVNLPKLDGEQIAVLRAVAFCSLNGGVASASSVWEQVRRGELGLRVGRPRVGRLLRALVGGGLVVELPRVGAARPFGLSSVGSRLLRDWGVEPGQSSGVGSGQSGESSRSTSGGLDVRAEDELAPLGFRPHDQKWLAHFRWYGSEAEFRAALGEEGLGYRSYDAMRNLGTSFQRSKGADGVAVLLQLKTRVEGQDPGVLLGYALVSVPAKFVVAVGESVEGGALVVERVVDVVRGEVEAGLKAARLAVDARRREGHELFRSRVPRLVFGFPDRLTGRIVDSLRMFQGELAVPGNLLARALDEGGFPAGESGGLKFDRSLTDGPPEIELTEPETQVADTAALLAEQKRLFVEGGHRREQAVQDSRLARGEWDLARLREHVERAELEARLELAQVEVAAGRERLDLQRRVELGRLEFQQDLRQVVSLQQLLALGGAPLARRGVDDVDSGVAYR